MFNANYLPIIAQATQTIRKQYGLDADSPIGDYIFVILNHECILIQWPEDGQLDLDGVSTEKVINGKLETVVYINSAKNKEKQNICAAHELGHRYKLDKLIRDAFPDDVYTPSIVEDIMNRFAAELMMPFNAFKKRAEVLYNDCFERHESQRRLFLKRLLQSIVELMDFYYVPYKAVVRRLQEVDIIPDWLCKYLLDFEESESGKSIVHMIIEERGITRLRVPDRKTQYSIPLKSIHSIAKNASITKYMTTPVLRSHLKMMGIKDSDIKVIETLKNLETQTINIDEVEDMDGT